MKSLYWGLIGAAAVSAAVLVFLWTPMLSVMSIFFFLGAVVFAAIWKGDGFTDIPPQHP